MAEKKTADEAVNDTTAENTNAVDDAQAPSTTDTTDTAAK